MNKMDALPLIDQQYDQPAVKQAVDALIADEMRRFPPATNYLAHLPPPQMKFRRSPILQAEYERIASSSAAVKLEMRRYSAPAPEEGLESDPQAWKAAINNAKAQLVQQSNRIMNAEVAQELGAPLWLQQNKTLQSLNAGLESKEQAVKRDIFDLNRQRVRLQEQVTPELQALQRRRNEALQKTLHYRQLYAQLGSRLQEEGLVEDVHATLQHRKQQREAVIDVHDPQHNSTVREYEAVNSSAEVVDESLPTRKRMRVQE